MTAAERKYEEGRRAGEVDAVMRACQLVDKRALASEEPLRGYLGELSLRIAALAGPAQARLDGGEDPIEPKEDEIGMRVALVLNAHLEAREKFFREERGSYQRPSIAAEREARKEIRAALIRHSETGGDRERWRKESAVLAAGIGVFYAPELNGEMDREAHEKWKLHQPIPKGWLPKIHLELWRAWKPQKGKPDPVLRYAEKCFERRREVAGGGREVEDGATVTVARKTSGPPWTCPPWTFMDDPPPESRLVLLAIYHEAGEFVIGSWSQTGESRVWHLSGKGTDFEKWGYRLLAWMSLPAWPEEIADGR